MIVIYAMCYKGLLSVYLLHLKNMHYFYNHKKLKSFLYCYLYLGIPSLQRLPWQTIKRNLGIGDTVCYQQGQ